MAQTQNTKHFKHYIRMARAAQLEAALYKDSEIAEFLNLSLAGLATLKQDPEYGRIRIAVRTGVVTDAEEELIQDQKYKYERLRNMVPLALQGLFDAARSSNEHVKVKACSEILDREGTLAKVSRIGLATDEQGGVGTVIDDEIAQNLLEIKKIQAERAKDKDKDAEIPPVTNTVQ